MAVVDKGREVALASIESAATQVTIYGDLGQTQTDFTPKSFSFNAPSEVNNVWTLSSSASVTFEITSGFLGSDSFTVQGIKILDTNDNELVVKALSSPVTYNDPGEFVVESYTLTIPN
jgi:hypothetical protein